MCVLSLLSLLGARASADLHSAAELAYSPDGRRLAVLDATASELVQVAAADGKILLRTKLDGKPAGLVWLPDSKSLYVSLAGKGRVARIQAEDGKELESLPCGRYPAGLAYSESHHLLLVADWGLDRLTAIDVTSGKVRAQVPGGCQPMAVEISPDHSVAVMTALLPSGAATEPNHAAEMTVVQLQDLSVRARIRLPLGSTGVRDVAISGDGRRAYVSHVVGRTYLPTTQVDRGWVNTNAISVLDLEQDRLMGTVLLDQVMQGAADPWGLAIAPKQGLLYVALSGVHQLGIVKLDVLSGLLKGQAASLVNDLAALERASAIQRLDLPLNGPRGLALAPDGNSLAIAGYFTGNVVVTDTQGGNPQSIPLGPQPSSTPEREGEIAFHDARTCFQTWLSCATCHPDARADGLNWDLLNDGVGNPKNARTMLWTNRTAPLMTLGVRSDLNAAIRAGYTHIQFGQPDEKKVQQIKAYFSSLEPVISPYRQEDGSLTPAAQRGRKLYEDERVGCAQCHPAPLYTDLRSVDVGTSLSFDQGATRFDTPSLIELWRNPPYLHHGQAATLRDVLTNDKHCNTAQLSPDQLDDLIAYLLSL